MSMFVHCSSVCSWTEGNTSFPSPPLPHLPLADHRGLALQGAGWQGGGICEPAAENLPNVRPQPPFQHLTFPCWDGLTATDLPACVRIIIKGCFLEEKKKLFLSSSIYYYVNHLSTNQECIVVLCCCCCCKCFLLSLQWLLSSASCPPHPPPQKRTEGSGDLTRGRGAFSSRIRCLSPE